MANSSTIPQLKLNNGLNIPVIGLGTWQAPADGSVYRAVRDALDVGYRHIDCAWAYGNQEEVGRAFADAIKNGVLKREDLFVTSKIWPTFYRKDRVPVCAKQILTSLGLDYIDLLLLHSPASLKQQDGVSVPTDSKGQTIGPDDGTHFIGAYQALESLVDQGLVRSIGVSNFNVDQMKRLLAVARIAPVTNQVELHPYLVQQELQDYSNQNRILLTAYSPLGNPGTGETWATENQDRLLKDPVVNRLAQKYGKNAGQILIKFQVARGNLVIPKSVRKERIASNIEVFDFDFTSEELAELASLDRNYRSCPWIFSKHLPEYPF